MPACSPLVPQLFSTILKVSTSKPLYAYWGGMLRRVTTPVTRAQKSGLILTSQHLTLAVSNIKSAPLQKPPQQVAQVYIDRLSSLGTRVREKMDAFGLTENKYLDPKTYREICASGLVAEIILLPYSQVRDYAVSLNERD